MKKFLFFAVMIVFAGIAGAQQLSETDRSQRRGEAHENFEKYSQELQLTEAQKSEILAIHDKYAQKKKAIRATATRDQFRDLNQQKQAEIESVLNEDQKKKYRQLKFEKTKRSRTKELIKPKK